MNSHAQKPNINDTQRYVPSLEVIRLEKENRLLRKELEAKDKRISLLEQEVQDLKILVVQLQAMVFKKKRIKKKDQDDDSGTDSSNDNDKSSGNKPRTRDSYRREQPGEDEVTQTEDYTLDQCIHCGGQLEEIDIFEAYIEDIVEKTKQVVKQIIHQYICLDCGRKQSKIPIPQGHNVRLGPKVKRLVLYKIYVSLNSYRDVIRYLKDCYNITISKGEILYIQLESAKRLLPIYNTLLDELIRQEALNADETGWKIKAVLNYLWILCSPASDAVVFHIGTRGKGNIVDLLKGFSGCLTTDCYKAYKNLINIVHQICWVHILREAKELKSSQELTQEQLKSAKDFYDHLSSIYQQLKSALAEPFKQQVRTTKKKQLINLLRTVNQFLLSDTPKKLKNLKARTQEYEAELFNCLDFKTALPENNLAERNLRHIVLKRVRSFGSQTTNGARMFAINASVILTFWKRYPDTFMLELGKVLEK